MDFAVDEGSKTPIYRQIADWLDGCIASGELAAGRRLLTERELCAALGIARGTVKNAYIELERRGKIEKIQGKGTFVVGGSAEKERDAAVSAIRRTLQSLRAYGMGAQEIGELVRREAWSRLPVRERVRVVWVDRTPELLEPAVRQLAQTCNVDVMPLLSDGAALPGGAYELLATSVPCFDALSAAARGSGVQVERVAFSLSGRTVGALARIGAQERFAALYSSSPFLDSLRESLAELGLLERADFYCLTAPQEELYAACARYSVVLVPPAYPEGSTQELAAHMQNDARLLPFEYVLDNGSLMHLRECAQRCWEQRVTQSTSGAQSANGQQGSVVNW